MKKYKIITAYPCVIKSQSQSCGLDENCTLVLEGEKMVSVYPVGKTDNFAFNIELDKLYESAFYQVNEDDEEAIIYLVDGIKSENAQVVNFGTTASPHIEIESESVTFHCQNFKRKVLTGKFANFDGYQKFDIMLAHLYDNDKHLIVAFNKKNGKAKSFKAQKVEIKNDNFILTQNLEDYAGQTLTYTLAFDREGLKKKNTTFSYNFDERPKLSTCEQVIPFAFLEAIKAENFQLAKSYLSSSLNIDESNLKSFFGKLDYFFPIADNKFCFHAGDGLQKLTFEIKNGKIVDIDVENLTK